jgi:hypothetical protein
MMGHLTGYQFSATPGSLPNSSEHFTDIASGPSFLTHDSVWLKKISARAERTQRPSLDGAWQYIGSLNSREM